MTGDAPAEARRWLRHIERAALLLLVLLTLLSTARLWADVGRPFPGFLIDYDWREEQFEYTVTTPPWWYIARQKLLPQNIEIHTLQGASPLLLPAMSALLWGQKISAEIAHHLHHGRTLTRSPIILFDWQYFLDLRLPTLIMTLVNLLIALLLHTARTDSPMRRALFSGVVCSAVVFGIDRPSLFWMEDRLTHLLMLITQIFTALTSLAMVSMACLFIPSRLARVRGSLIGVAGTACILTILLCVSADIMHGENGIVSATIFVKRMAEVNLALLFLFSVSVLTIVLCLFIALWRGRGDTIPALRAQLRAGRVVLAGLILAMPLVLLSLLGRLFGQEIAPFIGTFDLRFLLLFAPLFATSAIVHHKAFRQQSPLFIGILLLISAALVSSLLNSLYLAVALEDQHDLYIPSLFLPTFAIVLTTLSLVMFYPRLARRMTHPLERERFNLRAMRQLGERLRNSRDSDDPYYALIAELCAGFDLDYAALWLAAPTEGYFYRRIEREHAHAPALQSIRLPAIEMKLMCSQSYISINPPDLAFPEALNSLRSSQVVEGLLPLTRDGRLTGFLVVSLPRNADAFFPEDVEVLAYIAQQIAQHLYSLEYREESDRIRMWLHNETLTRLWRGYAELKQIQQHPQSKPFQPVIDSLLNDIDHTAGVIRRIHQGTFTQSLIDIPARCAEYQQRFGIDIDSTHVDRRLRLSPWLEHDIVQWMTEALNNIVHHAHASRATVTLAYHENTRRIRLMVHDNGMWKPPLDRGTGLARIADSVTAWGGSFTLETPRYGGTCLTIDLPYPEHLPAPAPAEPRPPARTR